MCGVGGWRRLSVRIGEVFEYCETTLFAGDTGHRMSDPPRRFAKDARVQWELLCINET
jgi:hypothetical protein